MKLNQISAGDAVTQSVVKAILENASVLQHAQFYSIVGSASYDRKTASATGGQFRSLDSDYPLNSVSPVFTNPALRILGDQVQVDQAHERRGTDVNSVRALELLNFAKNLGKQFQNYLFNGDSMTSSEQFDGLKVLVPSGQTLVASSNGLAVVTGSDNTARTAQQKFLELLDVLIEQTEGADLLVMDGKTLARLTTIASSQVTVSMNEFGKPVKHYNGVAITSAGYDKNGTRVIPHTETCGTSSATTSVYAMKFGAGTDYSIATNSGIEVKDLGVVGPFFTHKVEIDACPVLLNDKSVARLTGLIIS